MVVVVVLLGVAVWLFNYANLGRKNLLDGGKKVLVGQESSDVTDLDEAREGEDYVIQVIANNLKVPWSIVFTSNERMLVSERSGAIKVYTSSKLSREPLFEFAEVSSQAEEGLMGLALDPNYQLNKFLYACVAYAKGDQIIDKVVKLKDLGDKALLESVVLDDIPAAKFHAGCRIKFGPDGKLYVTTGDASNKQLAQDLNSLAGKILRLNTDGSVPSDNPIEGSVVYSYGHRNPQGIDWHPETKVMWSTEHGPSIFDGPAGGDEVNVIKAGENYGWPVVSHEESVSGMSDPKLLFTPAVAPASGMFYKSGVISQFKNRFFFGALVGEGLVMLEISTENPEEVVSFQKLEVNVGRVREVAEGLDGSIYFATSNGDGRGAPRAGDDKIFKITPLNN